MIKIKILLALALFLLGWVSETNANSYWIEVPENIWYYEKLTRLNKCSLKLKGCKIVYINRILIKRNLELLY